MKIVAPVLLAVFLAIGPAAQQTAAQAARPAPSAFCDPVVVSEYTPFSVPLDKASAAIPQSLEQIRSCRSGDCTTARPLEETDFRDISIWMNTQPGLEVVDYVRHERGDYFLMTVVIRDGTGARRRYTQVVRNGDACGIWATVPKAAIK